MKNVVLFAAHFVPGNLASVHRARLWASHLHEFGWRPTVVTTHWDFYGETPEMDLVSLLPPNLKVIRTKAFRTKPVRIVGDVGLRGFLWHYKALCKLADERALDFLHITIPSNYSALLGRMIFRRNKIPYGIDYIDPWVHEFPGSNVPFTKAWASARLAKILEPRAVKHARLITGVAPGYFDGVLARNPHLRTQAVSAAMSYGGAESDHEFVRKNPREPKLFCDSKEKFDLIYAGALLPRAFPILENFFQALQKLKTQNPKVSERLRVYFVGTGKSPNDPDGFNVKPLAEKYGLGGQVFEHPQRIGYLDVLAHLQSASGILVLGSTEPHYSPSKIFQAVMSRRPVFALLHEASSATEILRASKAGKVISFDGNSLPQPDQLANEIEQFVSADGYSPEKVNWKYLEQFSARESARKLAGALDEALAKSRTA